MTVEIVLPAVKPIKSKRQVASTAVLGAQWRMAAFVELHDADP